MASIDPNASIFPLEIYDRFFDHLEIEHVMKMRVVCKGFFYRITNFFFQQRCIQEKISLQKSEGQTWLLHYLSNSSFLIGHSKTLPIPTVFPIPHHPARQIFTSEDKLWITYSKALVQLDLQTSPPSIAKQFELKNGISCIGLHSSGIFWGTWNEGLFFYHFKSTAARQLFSDKPVHSICVNESTLLLSSGHNLEIFSTESFSQLATLNLGFNIDKILSLQGYYYFLSSKQVYSQKSSELFTTKPTLIKENVGDLYIWNDSLIFGLIDKNIEIKSQEESYFLDSKVYLNIKETKLCSAGVLCILNESNCFFGWDLSTKEWLFENLSAEKPVANFAISPHALLFSSWSTPPDYINLNKEKAQKKLSTTKHCYLSEIIGPKIVCIQQEHVFVYDFFNERLGTLSQDLSSITMHD